MADMSFTADEIEEGAKQEEGNFAPSFGIFKGVVTKAEILPGQDGKDKQTYKKSGRPFYNVKISISYEDSEKTVKTKIVFLHVGPYSAWMDLNKQFREATGMTKEDLLELKKYENKDIGIKIGAEQAYEGYSGDKELWNGYFVGEYEGKKFLQNNVLEFIDFKKVKVDAEFLQNEKDLRDAFKNGKQQPGIEKDERASDEVATAEDVKEAFNQDY